MKTTCKIITIAFLVLFTISSCEKDIRTPVIKPIMNGFNIRILNTCGEDVTLEYCDSSIFLPNQKDVFFDLYNPEWVWYFNLEQNMVCWRSDSIVLRFSDGKKAVHYTKDSIYYLDTLRCHSHLFTPAEHNILNFYNEAYNDSYIYYVDYGMDRAFYCYQITEYEYMNSQ